mmetsp:Transcript_34532/g.104151  ORF Transcript_34532/g.104151 Transcript_34532/m.104151 type:complete len:227 (-) Transcript_34532:440-1120(-)
MSGGTAVIWQSEAARTVSRSLVSRAISRSVSSFCDASSERSPVNGVSGASDVNLFAVTLTTSSLLHSPRSSGRDSRQLASASSALRFTSSLTSEGSFTSELCPMINSVRLVSRPRSGGSDTRRPLAIRSLKIFRVSHCHSVGSGSIGPSPASPSREIRSSADSSESATFTSSHLARAAAPACAASTRSFSANIFSLALMPASSSILACSARRAFEASMSSRFFFMA